jgi:hypothetical protein
VVGFAELRDKRPPSSQSPSWFDIVLWGGPGHDVIHYPLRHGTEFNIVAVYRMPHHADKADVAAERAELSRIAGQLSAGRRHQRI